MSYRVQFIDDDPQVRKALGDYFARVGHEVQRSADGKAGIADFQRFHPDVVVLDLHLPDMSGLKVLEELKKRGGTVLMLTGEGQVDEAVEAMRLGAENFLKKPVEMSHLLATVEKAAEKSLVLKENTELRARLAPNIKRQLTRAAIFGALLAGALFIGKLIGSGEERAAAPIPIPLPSSTDTVGVARGRDTTYRPPIGPGGGAGVSPIPPAAPAGGGRGRGF